jgi:hypothetical protein
MLSTIGHLICKHIVLIPSSYFCKRRSCNQWVQVPSFTLRDEATAVNIWLVWRRIYYSKSYPFEEITYLFIAYLKRKATSTKEEVVM